MFHCRGLDCAPFTTGLLGILAYELWTKISISKCSSDDLKKSYYAFGVIICEFLVSLFLATYQHVIAVIQNNRKLGVQLFAISGVMTGTVVSTIYVEITYVVGLQISKPVQL